MPLCIQKPPRVASAEINLIIISLCSNYLVVVTEDKKDGFVVEFGGSVVAADPLHFHLH